MVATDAAAQLHFGFGYTRTIDSFNYPVLNNAKAETSLNGVYAGIGVTIPVTQMLGITPGVYYSYNTDIDKDDIYGTSKVNSFTSEHYVKGVLDLSLKLPFTNDLALLVFAGPRYAYGISSQKTYDTNISGIDKVTIDKYDPDLWYAYSRGNFLVGAGAGLEFMNALRLQVGYDYGLSNRYTGKLNVVHSDSMLNVGLAVIF